MTIKKIDFFNPPGQYDDEKEFVVYDGDGWPRVLPIGTEYTRCPECNSILVGSEESHDHECWK